MCPISWAFIMAYSEAKLESSGDKASSCCRPFWLGKLSNKCLPMWTSLYVSFKHNLISVTSFFFFGEGFPKLFENIARDILNIMQHVNLHQAWNYFGAPWGTDGVYLVEVLLRADSFVAATVTLKQSMLFIWEIISNTHTTFSFMLTYCRWVSFLIF